MAVVLAEFADPIAYNDVLYHAQACAAQAANVWEGWVEFVPLEGGPAIRTTRETTQPNFVDAQYWASGLTRIYLEGALSRALNPVVRKVVAPSRAMFDGPAPEAILDPFAVYEKGEALLRQELNAMSAWHLVNIVRAYELSDRPAGELSGMPAPSLIEVIVSGVREEAPTRD